MQPRATSTIMPLRLFPAGSVYGPFYLSSVKPNYWLERFPGLWLRSGCDFLPYQAQPNGLADNRPHSVRRRLKTNISDESVPHLPLTSPERIRGPCGRGRSLPGRTGRPQRKDFIFAVQGACSRHRCVGGSTTPAVVRTRVSRTCFSISSALTAPKFIYPNLRAQ